MNLIVVLFFFTNFIFCFVFTVALARVHYWSLSLPNTKEAKFRPQSWSGLIFVWTIPIRNQIGFLRSPKSIQGFFKSASPNIQEGAQDQIESESKSTKHSNPNPIPNQTNFRKTTYKIKKLASTTSAMQLLTGARTGVASGASKSGAHVRPHARSQAANATAAAHHGVEACGHQRGGPCGCQATWARRSRPPGRLSATIGRLEGAARAATRDAGHAAAGAPGLAARDRRDV